MDVLLEQPEVGEIADLRGLVAELRAEIAGLRREVSELRCEAGYWKGRHADAIERNARLEQELVAARADGHTVRPSLVALDSISTRVKRVGFAWERGKVSPQVLR